MNYALMVEPNRKYPVAYIIKQNGERVYGRFSLLGADMTEKQIEQFVGRLRLVN